jgi:hypothetical protein
MSRKPIFASDRANEMAEAGCRGAKERPDVVDDVPSGTWLLDNEPDEKGHDQVRQDLFDLHCGLPGSADIST